MSQRRSLEDVLQSAGNPVDMLRNSQIGAYVYPVVPTEYSNWRDEQRAWRDSAVLFDQSHHMAELLVTGPDAFKFLSYLATNSFASFPTNRAKQFAPSSYDGYTIGDLEAGVLAGSIVAVQRDMSTRERKYIIRGTTITGRAIELVAKFGVTGSMVVITVYEP